jgi:hypothetical protein
MDGQVCGKGPSFLGRSLMGMCVARGLASLVVHGWACVWQGASFPWEFMGVCVARCLVPLAVHGHVCGQVPCSLG